MRQAVEALNEMDPEQLKRLFREVRQHRLEADMQIVSAQMAFTPDYSTIDFGPAGQYGHAGMACQP